MKKLITILLIMISSITIAQTQDVFKDKVYKVAIEDSVITCYKVVRKYSISNEYHPVYIYVWGLVPTKYSDMNSYDMWPMTFSMRVQFWYGVKVNGVWVESPIGEISDTDWVEINKYYHGNK